MTNVKREQVKKLLTLFFPKELADIIIEYLIQIEHECRLIKTATRNHSSNYFVSNNDKMYEYDISEKCLFSKLINEITGMHSCNKLICTYENDIYAYDIEKHMYVFGNNCEQIHTFEFSDDVVCYNDLIIVVAAKKIFICNVGKKIIVITDLQGKFIKNIDTQNELCHMVSYDKYIYALTKTEKNNFIHKYSFDGDLVKTYDFNEKLKDNMISNFVVIDNIIYLNLQDKSQKYIYEYEDDILHSNIHFDRISWSTDIEEITFNNNLLIACDYRKVYIFKYVKKECL